MNIDVIIEVDRNSDKRAILKNGAIIGYREMLAPYPYPYGYILNTMGDDKEELDCFVITEKILPPGTVVKCQTIAAFEFKENDEKEYKILAALDQTEPTDSTLVYATLVDFLKTIFKKYPDIHVSFGDLVTKEKTDRIIRRYKTLS